MRPVPFGSLELRFSDRYILTTILLTAESALLEISRKLRYQKLLIANFSANIDIIFLKMRLYDCYHCYFLDSKGAVEKL